jgi:hypothetical protein
MFAWRFLTLPLLLLGVACVSAPDLRRAPRIEMRFGEKPKAKPTPKPKPKASEEPVLEKETPDPPAQSSKKQWWFEFKMDHQALSLVRSERRVLSEERVTPRRYGRFALEAYRGNDLVERLRFDFPLLGDTRSAIDEVEPGLVTSVGVEFPELDGVTRLEVVDRKSRKITSVPLPAGEPAASEPAASEPAASEPAPSEPATMGPASGEPRAREPETAGAKTGKSGVAGPSSEPRAPNTPNPP